MNSFSLLFAHAHSSRSSVRDAVTNIAYTRGTTNTAEALRYSRETMFTSNNGERDGVPNIMIVITDGGSNNKEETLEQAFQVGMLHYYTGIV